MRVPVASQYLGVSESTFMRWVQEGFVPAPVKRGRITLWDVKVLDAVADSLSAQGGGSQIAPILL